MSERKLKALSEAVLFFDDGARRLAEEAVTAGMDPVMVLEKGLARTLRDTELKKRAKIIVGGAPVTQAWVDEIGADAAGFDAGSAVQVALELMRWGLGCSGFQAPLQGGH